MLGLWSEISILESGSSETLWGGSTIINNIKTIVDSLTSEHGLDWLHITLGQLWSFKLVEYTSNQLRVHSDYHSVLKDGSHDRSKQDVNDFLDWRKLSYQPSRYQRIQDKNWSHIVIFSYWTYHQPRDISEEGCRTGRWSNYSIKSEVDQLGLNKGVRSVIVNPLVVRSRTDVHQVW
jgi:hypothetical protein